jgi:3-oxoacyl-(acyl-carrier-protein) synthase III
LLAPQSSTRATAVGVLGTGSYVPNRILRNDELAVMVDKTANWIEERTGVLERRVASPEEATSDLAVAAARQALNASGVSASDIGLIVVGTSTPDQPIPSTACTVQAKLGIRRTVAMDIEAVCSGFVYALGIARAMLATEEHLRYALVIGADIYSRILDYRDPKTAVLFGDGAGAVVLGRTDLPDGIRHMRLNADGGRADLVRIPAGGSARPASAGTVTEGLHYFQMQGREVRAFVHEMFAEMMADALDRSRLHVSEIDLVVPHQANMRLLEECAKENSLLPEQLFLCGARYGNTGAASVPLALDRAVRGNCIRGGDHVLLVALGGGMTWGWVLMRWCGHPQPTREAR